MPDNFLVGCAANYKCGGQRKCYPVTGIGAGSTFCGPQDGFTLSPWVRVKFTSDQGREVTVGNLSSPENQNLAVIKDFEFSGADGVQVSVTIHDQRGGSFVKFMDDLITDAKCLNPSGIRMKTQWGWVKTNCEGFSIGEPVVKSGEHHVLPLNVECSFSGGKFMFTITGTDMGLRMFEGRAKVIIGEKGKEVCLEDALRELFTESCGPKVKTVDFLNKDLTPGICWEKQDCGECTAEGGTNKGPKGVWEGEARSKIDIANAWIRNNGKTINGHSCRVTYDSEAPGGKIVIIEDAKPTPGESRDWDRLCIGTYIVNGGYRSSVIQFNPRIKWVFTGVGAGTGGETGTNSAHGGLEDGGEVKGDERSATLIKPYIECVGTEISSPPDANADDREGRTAEADTADAAIKHNKALNLLHDVIEADLVIVGDPTLPRPLELNNIRTVSIVFINPYHLISADQFNLVVDAQPTGINPARVRTDSACGEWLAEPTCNEVLSNKAWWIKQVTHKISAGSYQTTLRVYLAGPGTDLECFDPLGGVGSQGWKPKCCQDVTTE